MKVFYSTAQYELQPQIGTELTRQKIICLEQLTIQG